MRFSIPLSNFHLIGGGGGVKIYNYCVGLLNQTLRNANEPPIIIILLSFMHTIFSK